MERRLQQLGELDRRRAQEEERRIRHGDRVPLPPGICRSARTIFTIAQGESRCFTPS